MNYSELLQLAKGLGNFISDRIIIWRLLSYKNAFNDQKHQIPANNSYHVKNNIINIKSTKFSKELKNLYQQYRSKASKENTYR